mmetsp:Transcript_103112/g.261857  ORF Transcript_103112/g.261857 Transcript_103112/m.261857 type:complete len:155 (+) Transcript_103112:104-568(+)
MVYRFSVAALIGLASLASAQDSPAPPPAPPAPPPLPPATAGAPGAKAVDDFDHDAHMHASRERHLKSMETSGVHYQRGVWSYGDYKHNIDGVTTPHGCAAACEADEGCLHWNFNVVHHTCSLKGDASGHDDGVPDWISGNAKRYVSRPKTSTEL